MSEKDYPQLISSSRIDACFYPASRCIKPGPWHDTVTSLWSLPNNPTRVLLEGLKPMLKDAVDEGWDE